MVQLPPAMMRGSVGEVTGPNVMQLTPSCEKQEGGRKGGEDGGRKGGKDGKREGRKDAEKERQRGQE